MRVAMVLMAQETSILAPPQLCVMLGGGLTSPPLEQALGVSVLDLPIDRTRKVIDGWLEAVSQLAKLAGVASSALPTVVTLGNSTANRFEQGVEPPEGVRISRDENEFRGPAGAIKDAASSVDDDRDILICELGMWGAVDLRSALWSHRDNGADVTICRNPDRTPAGLILAKGWTLSLIPEKGFMDLKEQWLSRVMSEGASVRVFDCAEPGLFSLRTREGYLEMCRVMNSKDPHAPRRRSLFVSPEQVSSSWSLEVEGSTVDPGALVVDSVVMRGATVEKDAVVVRSVIGRGARVSSGRHVVDSVVGASGVSRG